MVIGFIRGAMRKIRFQKGSVRRKSLGTAALSNTINLNHLKYEFLKHRDLNKCIIIRKKIYEHVW
jgi:hypothetical protein